MTDDSLLEDLARATNPRQNPPPKWQPGVIYQGRMPSEITTPPLPKMENEEEYEEAVKALGFPLPTGYTLMLIEAQYVYHENFWTREEQGEDAVTKPSSSWRYRFKVVPKSVFDDDDLAALIAEAKAHRPRRWLDEDVHVGTRRTKVINLADFQIGKFDELGGTKEALERSEIALARVIEMLERDVYDEVILADLGDSTEGYESAPNADRMNDLSMTKQIRVWRRILWRWIDAIAPLVPSLKVIGVPSNHCRVRRGKNVMGDPLDDWGIETIASVQDIAGVNPASYGHVEFIVPEEFQEHVLITLVGGQTIGFIHGHQASKPEALIEVIKRNSRQGIGIADIVCAGHFHHLRVVSFGSEQTLFIAPTNDNGSSWFQYSGERSRPGVLTFDVDHDGWRGQEVVWTDRMLVS